VSVFNIKQPASRWIRDNNILLTGNQTSTPSTNFSASTQQIRVCSNLSGFLQIDGSGTATANVSMLIPANTPEYFIVTAGQLCAFVSTSTSTGVCSVQELS
jgi:hypothetical protein